MAYIYSGVDNLAGTEKVGTKACAVLVQHYASAPNTSLWKEGVKVKGSTTIVKGTAIATFVGGKYPNKKTGNHAALYVSQDESGIWVMDQWKDDTEKPKVSKRLLTFRGKNTDGTYKSPSNNGDAFSVIE